jgi:hypothetical protein
MLQKVVDTESTDSDEEMLGKQMHVTSGIETTNERGHARQM